MQISDLLKGTPAGSQVSNADLIALAGAHAVAICGGPQIDVAVGRVDAAGPDPEGRMVSEKAGAAALVANFAEKGLSVQELVALSGAHTLGKRAVVTTMVPEVGCMRCIAAGLLHQSAWLCICTSPCIECLCDRRLVCFFVTGCSVSMLCWTSSQLACCGWLCVVTAQTWACGRMVHSGQLLEGKG